MRTGWRGKNVCGSREVVYSLEKKKNGIRWAEEDESDVPNAPPMNGVQVFTSSFVA